MTDSEIKRIADDADIIVNGYAFTKSNNIIKVINLNNPCKASVIAKNGEITETTMDDIEISIIKDYFSNTMVTFSRFAVSHSSFSLQLSGVALSGTMVPSLIFANRSLYWSTVKFLRLHVSVGSPVASSAAPRF